MSQKQKKGPSLCLHQCELCQFSSKNIYIFKRHKIRCQKEHGISRYKKRGKQFITAEDGTSDNVGDNVETNSDNETLSIADTESNQDLSALEHGTMLEDGTIKDTYSCEKPLPAKKRMYSCVKCDFTTRSSRDFLYHHVNHHNMNFDIFSCTECVYCSKYRHKISRHLKFAHGIEPTAKHLTPEHAAQRIVAKHNSLVLSSPTKNLKTQSPKKITSRRKLMVKFARPQFGVKSSATTLAAPNSTFSNKAIQSSLTNDTRIPHQTDQLSRVVDDILGDDGQLLFKCKECQFTSDDKHKVAKHAVSWHVDTKSFTCSHCDYITFERNDFIVHRKTHRDEHSYKCVECNFSTDFRPNFDRHLMNHKGSWPFKCASCTYGCGSDAAMKRHVASNHESAPSPSKKMKLPPLKSMTAASVSSPIMSTDANKLMTTTEGETSLSKLNQSLKHSSNINQFGVGMFYPVSQSQSFLDTNSISMVPRPVLPPPNMESAALLGRELSPQRKLPPNITQYVERDNGKLVCPVCKLKYKRSSDLNRHMKRKHGVKLREFLETSDLLTPFSNSDNLNTSYTSAVSTLQENNAEFVCEDVEIMDDDGNDVLDITNNSALDLSVKTDADETVPPEKLKCKYCSYQAKWVSDLRRHYSVHSIEKRYKCNWCPKKYKYIGDMNVHIRKDHNMEPGEIKVVKVATIPKKKTTPAIFKCPCCSYSSAWKSEVDRHSRLHTGEKTFKCANCEYQTFWRGDIRRHVYKRHPSLMTEGVAINDVIIIRKDKPAEIANQEQVIGQQEAVESDLNLQLVDNTAKEVSTSNVDISNSHECSPEINMNEYMVQVMSGHSPTPSPIKDLGGGLYKCQYCGFVANAPSKMNSHISTHTNLKRYMCPVCGRRANWKWDIAKHIRRDHNDEVTQVIKLGKQEAEETIKAYMEEHPVVRRDHHLNLTPDKAPSMEIGDTFFKCSLCDFSAERRISVSRHMRYMHDGREATIQMITKQGPQKMPEHVTPQKIVEEPVKLPIPPTPASTIQSPVKHTYSHLIENFGPRDAVRPFMCSECGKRGATKGDVKKHYHYAHSEKEIRIIYLGDGSQSVYSAKVEQCAKPFEQPLSDPIQPLPSQPTVAEISPKQTAPSKHPKVLGYIKPFKCGLCGRRSNWKWDTARHIRERHRGQQVNIIELSEEEARSTIGEYVNTQLPELNRASNSVPKKHKFVEVEILEQSADGPLVVKKKSRLPSVGQFKQYKCSCCAYRSNYRSDIQRHISRRHGVSRGKVTLLDKETAKATLDSYNYTRATTKAAILHEQRNSGLLPGATNVAAGYSLNADRPAGPLPAEAWAGLEKKIWKCSMCSYSNEDKVHVLKHLGKHNMKAYKCTSCNWTSNFRSAVQRHIQSKHPLDDSALCRLCIKLIKEGPGVDQSGQSIMPEMGPLSLAEYQPGHLNSYDSSLHQSDVNMTQYGVEGDSPDQLSVSTAVFNCKLCNFNSTWRSCVCRHIKSSHKTKDYCALIVKKIVRIGHSPGLPLSSTPVTQQIPQAPSSPFSNHTNSSSDSPFKDGSFRMRPKNFVCNMCPYRTYKAKMLRFHMSCHKPQPGVKQVKCKYCPYYISGSRLMTQHTALHLQGFKAPSAQEEGYPVTPVKLLSVSGPSSYGSRSPQVPKRHRCEKCPYTTNSKSDFFYHKQFHRPKPTADYKCDFCDYWVTHRRLLSQHLKVHEHEDGYSSDIPLTPTKSDYIENSLVYDTVEIAAIKQRIIASKITPSISQSPLVSPMKIASSCSVGGRRGFLRKDGSYRKIHQCCHCPYMNIRLRNMKLHELMHGKRSASHPLMKCIHCDYYVGSKGLLAHHLKVHQPGYSADFKAHDKERNDSVASEDSEMDANVPMEKKVDTLLEITRYKKYGCEKCPYATSKRQRFQRHVELHGSKQKCKCDFCDYSVPTNILLTQHLKLHFEPNQNLLAAQSILNLQFLPDMPADVALASMLTNNDAKNPVSITHDHIDLYENQSENMEPKKLYRCDRCPYANVRRDHLLAHLRCHMVKNEFSCPYCDYSVGKINVLIQHVKVHFSPLPELSEWLAENGVTERIKELKQCGIKEAQDVAKLFQSDNKEGPETDAKMGIGSDVKVDIDTKSEKEKMVSEDKSDVTIDLSDQNGMEIIDKEESKHTKDVNTELNMEVDELEDVTKKDHVNPDGTSMETCEKVDESEIMQELSSTASESKDDDEVLKVDGEHSMNEEAYVCQYCDRDYPTSDGLLRHEMQHLIGSNYQELVTQLLHTAQIQKVLEQASPVQDLNKDISIKFDKTITTKPTDCNNIGDVKYVIANTVEAGLDEQKMKTVSVNSSVDMSVDTKDKDDVTEMELN